MLLSSGLHYQHHQSVFLLLGALLLVFVLPETQDITVTLSDVVVSSSSMFFSLVIAVVGGGVHEEQ